MTTLKEAAQAVLDRWDSPAWEWGKQGPTADLMAALRAALAEHDKDREYIEQLKAHWARQRKMAEETVERDRQQREYEEAKMAALAEPVQEPQRKPLTDEEICDLMEQIPREDVDSWSFRQGVYSAEAAHGIKEEK